MKKDNWKGQKLINKLILGPLIILYPFFFAGLNLFAENPYILLAMAIIFAFWILTLLYLSEKKKNDIMSKKRGCKLWKGDYAKGKDTGEFKWGIKDIFDITAVRDYTKESITYSELHMIKQEAKNRMLGIIKPKEGDAPLISMVKIEKLLTYFEKDRIEVDSGNLQLQSEYINDKILERFYELETKKQAILTMDYTTQYTDDFLDWREGNSQMEIILRKEVKSQLKTLRDNNPITEEELKKKKLNQIAVDLARKFPLREIESAKIDGEEGAACQGYLQRYKDHKELIQKHFILDKAAEIARRLNIPMVYGIVEHVHLKECFKTIVVLDKEYGFDDEPGLPFDQVLVYSDRPFINAIVWKENQKEEIDDYPDIPMTVGKCNLNILTRAEHNTPMCHLAHAPGKGYSVKNLEYDAEEIEEQKLEYNVDIIQDLRNELSEQKERAEEFEKRVSFEKKMKTDAIVRLELMREKKAQKDIDKITNEILEDNKIMSKKKKIFLGIVGGLSLLACILLLVFVG